MKIKIVITDGDALRSIKPLAIRAYLEANGWEYVGAWRTSGWIFSRGDEEIFIPNRDDYADYARRVQETLELLSELNEQTQLDVFNQISAIEIPPG